jgi:hypothetical protein
LDEVRPAAQNNVYVVTHNCIATNIDCENRRELLELFANPIFALFIAPAGEAIEAAEKRPAHTPGDAVIDADRVAVHELMARISWHDRHARTRIAMPLVENQDAMHVLGLRQGQD